MKRAAQPVSGRFGVACRIGLLARLGVAAVLSAGACTAGNYEIADCDPGAVTLVTDACDKFNTDPNDCTPYQCDRTTLRCVKSPRDWDRDGYPDSRCGGTDCDDRNPLITGATNGECSCSIAGKICAAGQGACKRFASYVCQNNVAVCPALAAQPSDWRTSPYSDAPSGYRSEDWNCDGTMERACCYLNSNGTQICQSCPKQTSLCSSDVTTVCASICKTMNGNNTACQATSQSGIPKVVTCDDALCGSKVAICYCSPGSWLQGYPCNVQKATEDRLNCR